MSFSFGKVSQNITEVRESPYLWIVGFDSTISIQVDGTGTLASATMALYENGTDVSSTKLTGSLSISGRVITTKTFASLVGGSTYKFYVYFTDEGVEQVREGTIYCCKLGVNPSKAYPSVINRYKVDESPITIHPGQTKTLQMTIAGYGEIEATTPAPTMSLYKGTQDASALLSGSLSVSTRTITLKAISGLAGGSEYLFYVMFRDGGKDTIRYGEIICPKLGS